VIATANVHELMVLTPFASFVILRQSNLSVLPAVLILT